MPSRIAGREGVRLSGLSARVIMEDRWAGARATDRVRRGLGGIPVARAIRHAGRGSAVTVWRPRFTVRG